MNIKSIINYIFSWRKVSLPEPYSGQWRTHFYRVHKIPVFDTKGNLLEMCEEHINVKKIVRQEHKIGDEICYSFDNYLKNGMISYGMIIPSGFKDVKIIN